MLNKGLNAPMNFSALKRMDPAIEEILMSANHCTLYEMVGSQWEKREIQGPVFLVRRDREPSGRIFILNTLGKSSFALDIHGEYDIDLTTPGKYMFRDRSQEPPRVYATWFPDVDEGDGLLFMKAFKAAVRARGAAAAAAAAPVTAAMSGAPLLTSPLKVLSPAGSAAPSRAGGTSSTSSVATVSVVGGSGQASAVLVGGHDAAMSASVAALFGRGGGAAAALDGPPSLRAYASAGSASEVLAAAGGGRASSGAGGVGTGGAAALHVHEVRVPSPARLLVALPDSGGGAPAPAGAVAPSTGGGRPSQAPPWPSRL